MKNFKVAAYITAYEDCRAVEACVKAIKNQSYPVEKIFIVDNSSQLLLLCNDDADIIIDGHPENVGVAGGLKLGLEWAVKQNYDFLWTFDQDSIPSSNCLELLIEAYQDILQDNYQIGIIAPTAIDSKTNTVVQGQYLSAIASLVVNIVK